MLAQALDSPSVSVMYLSSLRAENLSFIYRFVCRHCFKLFYFYVGCFSFILLIIYSCVCSDSHFPLVYFVIYLATGSFLCCSINFLIGISFSVHYSPCVTQPSFVSQQEKDTKRDFMSEAFFWRRKKCSRVKVPCGRKWPKLASGFKIFNYYKL